MYNPEKTGSHNTELEMFEQRAITVYAENIAQAKTIHPDMLHDFFQIYDGVPNTNAIIESLYEVPMSEHKLLMVSMARAQVWCDEQSIQDASDRLQSIWDAGLSKSEPGSLFAENRQWEPWELVDAATDSFALPLARRVLDAERGHFTDEKYLTALQRIAVQYAYTAKSAEEIRPALEICDEIEPYGRVLSPANSSGRYVLTEEIRRACVAALMRIEDQTFPPPTLDTCANPDLKVAGEVMLQIYDTQGLTAALNAVSGRRYSSSANIGYLMAEVAQVDTTDVRLKELASQHLETLAEEYSYVTPRQHMLAMRSLIEFYGRAGNFDEAKGLIATLPQASSETPYSHNTRTHADAQLIFMNAYFKHHLPRNSQDAPFVGNALANVLQYARTHLPEESRINQYKELMRQLGAHGCSDEVAYVARFLNDQPRAKKDVAEHLRTAYLVRGNFESYLGSIENRIHKPSENLAALCELLRELRGRMDGKQAEFPRYF